MPAVFKVLKPGMLTTVQDLGRFGSRHMGVPVSGAVDSLSFRIANTLVGNPVNAACLELSMSGPEFLVLEDSIIAITGADMGAEVSGNTVRMWESFFCSAGEILKFGGQRIGCRSYIAVSGGIEVPTVLGSRSTLLSAGIGGYLGRSVLKGDIIYSGETTLEITQLGKQFPPELRPVFNSHVILGVLRGINADEFVPAEYQKLFSQSFVVTKQSNRMGCCLEGKNPIRTNNPAFNESYPVSPGSIQILPSGMPVILLNDAQSTGGYSQIACVASADLWKLGQVLPGDTISFQEIDFVRAEDLLKNQRLLVKSIESSFSVRFIKKAEKSRFEVRMENLILD